jgi:hypothetical protein
MANETALQQASNQPIETDEQLRGLAQALLEKAVRRQCWLMFFTSDHTPIELLIPIEELPYEPDGDVGNFARVVFDIMQRCGAIEVVVAWERVGGPDLMPSEQLWVDAVDREFALAGVRIRGQVLVYDDGVALIDGVGSALLGRVGAL